MPAWMSRESDKVLSKSKLLMCDTGLMSFLAGIGSKEPLADVRREWKIYHYRNARGREIDFLLENMAGDLICFEVKTSEGTKSDHFKNLRWFREQYGEKRRIKTVVLYCGIEDCQYSENEWALPMAYLWK